MKPLKLIKHIRKVGWKKFREEYKEGQREVEADPIVNLRLQMIGYLGVIVFSLVSSGMFFYAKLWYVACIFIFNCLIQFASLRNTKSQIKMYQDIKQQEKEMIEEGETI